MLIDSECSLENIFSRELKYDRLPDKIYFSNFGRRLFKFLALFLANIGIEYSKEHCFSFSIIKIIEKPQVRLLRHTTKKQT